MGKVKMESPTFSKTLDELFLPSLVYDALKAWIHFEFRTSNKLFEIFTNSKTFIYMH